MIPKVLGLDIGGANLKAAMSDGRAWTTPFAVWKNPGGLTAELERLIGNTPTAQTLAVTMTAELCDCFESKRHGVNAILEAVTIAAGERNVVVWQTTSEFVSVAEARSTYVTTAASNWLALATLVGRRFANDAAILVDIGSTTTDIIPIVQGKPIAVGRTDTERLVHRELVYFGVQRTPIPAVVSHWHWRGSSIRLAAEVFATAQDAYLLLGEIEENRRDHDTADSRPATREFAHARMARTVCADGADLTRAETTAFARRFQEAQIVVLLDAVDRARSRLPDQDCTLILAGSGEFLGRAMAARLDGIESVVSLSTVLGHHVSAAACAYAVAVLAEEKYP